MTPPLPPAGPAPRAIGLLLVPVLALALAVIRPAGGTPPTATPTSSPSTSLGADSRVLCTVFSVYALTRELLAGTPIAVDLLLPAGLGCPHSYALTPTDLQTIAKASCLICLGLGFEPFLERITREYPVPVLRSAEGFPVLTSVVAHGDHAHEQVNAHLFTTPAGLKHLTERIAGFLQERWAIHRDRIGANADRLLATFADLDTAWKEARRRGEGTPVLLAQDSLDYIARDLGLRVVGRVGGGEGASLSAGEMVALIKTIREQRPVAIVVDAQARVPAAETLASETGLPLVALDTLARGPDPLPEGYLASTLRRTLDQLQAFFPAEATGSAPLQEFR